MTDACARRTLIVRLREDTRAKGLRELVDRGMADVRRASITPDTFDFRRLRNVYSLDENWIKTRSAAEDFKRFRRPSGPLPLTQVGTDKDGRPVLVRGGRVSDLLALEDNAAARTESNAKPDE